MRLLNRKQTLLLLFITLLTIALAVIPNILSPEIEALIKGKLGDQYKIYLFLLLPIAAFVLAYLTTDLNNKLTVARSKRLEELNIPATKENRQLIKAARKAIEQAEPEEALKQLSLLKIPDVDNKISLLTNRLTAYRRENSQGVQTNEEKNVTFNRINKSILSLIISLEQTLAKEEKYFEQIKEYLHTRYDKLLKDKLLNKQPIILKLIPSNEGVIKDINADFTKYKGEEIPEKIAEIFEYSNGKLLIIGDPGSGKTVLLLQLALQLLELEQDAIPIILNLVTWRSSFETIDAWLEKVLPLELAVNTALAKKIIRDTPLILLLDGLDEIANDKLIKLNSYLTKMLNNFHNNVDKFMMEFEKLDSETEIVKEVTSEAKGEFKEDINSIQESLERLGHKLNKLKELGNLISQIAIEENTIYYILARIKELEVNVEEEKKSFLRAISNEGNNDKIRLVITSRKEEYQLTTHDAPVNIKIEVHALTFEQIEAQLTKGENLQSVDLELLKRIKNDPLLAEVVKIPFYFNILHFLFSKGLVLDGFQFSTLSLPERLQEIVEQFARKATQEETNKRFSNKLMSKWLSFFAYKMNEHNLVVFELLNLQYNWENWSKKQLIIPNIINNIIDLTTSILSHSLFIALSFLILGAKKFALLSFVVALFTYFVGILFQDIFFHSGEPKIESKGNIKLSFKTFFFFWKGMLIGNFLYGMMVGLAIALISLAFNNWEIGTIISKLVFILILVLIYGLFGVLFLGLFSGLDGMVSISTYSFLRITTPYQRFIASAKVLHLSILQHWLLRYQLYRKGVLPFRLVDFLNEMVERGILISDGATWRFRHRILQDYFASLWKEDEKDE